MQILEPPRTTTDTAGGASRPQEPASKDGRNWSHTRRSDRGDDTGWSSHKQQILEPSPEQQITGVTTSSNKHEDKSCSPLHRELLNSSNIQFPTKSIYTYLNNPLLDKPLKRFCPTPFISGVTANTVGTSRSTPPPLAVPMCTCKCISLQIQRFNYFQNSTTVSLITYLGL